MSHEQQTIIEAFGLSHVGTVREENQDAIHLCDETDEFTSLYGHLYAVADGMGGYAHGGEASKIALTVFCDAFYAGSGNPIVQKMKTGIQNANIGVYQAARRLKAGRMGTTLTAVHIHGRMLHGIHVGDSRAYLLRDGKSTCLTNDHTRVGELVRMKILSPEKVRTHSQRSMLNRSIGLELFVQPDQFRLPLREDDLIVLCSDGVWSVIEDDEFADFARGTRSAEQLCSTLIDEAMRRESDDNLSVVTLRMHSLVDHPSSHTGTGVWGKIPGLFRRLSGREGKT
ncbi:MAG TPA: protein phosphatase 2C domain-containing protein [Bacteroidota bacterium]|nr:protein phosphatase 2C domain-containing protein [Bacteroidota bacterium]